MQTKITDKDFYKSAGNLTRQDLGAQIYEAIHLLGSLLNCVDNLILSDKCKEKIKNYKNYPQGKLWIGYEKELFGYIFIHLMEQISNKIKKDGKFVTSINKQNFDILKNELFQNIEDWLYFKLGEGKRAYNITWITDELIQTHRSVLIQKEIEKNIKIIKKYPDYQGISNKEEFERMEKRLSYHYRNLWPNCPRDLKMRYDFRERAV